METQIKPGDPLAKKVFGAAVFGELVKKPTLLNRITGSPPTLAEAVKKLEKMQSSPDYPCIRVMNLAREKGDTLSVDMFNVLEGIPVTGDRRLSGRMMSLERSSMDIKIDQIRAGVDTGGRMTRQRTIHNLRTVGRGALLGYWARMRDQIGLCHIAGARGYHNTAEWAIPLDSHPEFGDIVVNPIQATTYSRHFNAGSAADIEALTATQDSILGLNDIDRLRAAIDEDEVQMQPIKLPDDESSDDDPLFLLLVTPRQWHYLQVATGDTAWRTFLQNARERSSKNPLFRGTPGMWNGILVRKYPWPIRFNQGDDVVVATSADTYTEETKTVGASQFAAATPTGQHAVDRAILLGAQAVAELYGKATSGMPFDWHEETTDHGAVHEASLASMGGFAKLRFKTKSGKDFDHGVMTIDSYAPDPRTVAYPSS